MHSKSYENLQKKPKLACNFNQTLFCATANDKPIKVTNSLFLESSPSQVSLGELFWTTRLPNYAEPLNRIEGNALLRQYL